MTPFSVNRHVYPTCLSVEYVSLANGEKTREIQNYLQLNQNFQIKIFVRYFAICTLSTKFIILDVMYISLVIADSIGLERSSHTFKIGKPN